MQSKHRLVSSPSSVFSLSQEAALTKVPPSAPTKAQMGAVVDDDDLMMMLSDCTVDALFKSDEQL